MDDLYSLFVLLKQLWLLWFLALFVGIVFWAFRPGGRDASQQHAGIPFRDDHPSSAPPL
jgi:cytochrome c oxidase cbb3-type subunit IV